MIIRVQKYNLCISVLSVGNYSCHSSYSCSKRIIRVICGCSIRFRFRFRHRLLNIFCVNLCNLWETSFL